MQAEVHALLGPGRAPPSALRILARRGDSQVLIVHGEDRAVGADERLAWIDWFPTAAVAQSFSHFCSDRLISCQLPPDKDGWHAFAVEHLSNLIANARTHLNVTYHPSVEATPRQAWTPERDARLCFLGGQGFTAKAIAEDALVRSTEGAVFKRAQRLGIALSAVSSGQITIRRLPAHVLDAIRRGAERERLTREAYASKRLIEVILVELAGRQLTAAI